MSYRGDDLAPLLIPPDAPGVGFRQGVILSWNQDTAENTVQVAGSILTDLPILNTAEALLLRPGSVVGIMTAGSSWFILGRITVPGSPDAVATLGAGMRAANSIFNTPITNTTPYALNGGPSVTTQVLSTGQVFALFASGMDLDVGEGVNLAVFGVGPGGATVGPIGQLSGANVLTSSATLGGTINLSSATGELITGLAPGEWTFELRSYKTSGLNPAVWSRVLTIMPL